MAKKYDSPEEMRAAREKEMEELRKQLQGEEELPKDSAVQEPEIESSGEPELEVPSETAENEPEREERPENEGDEQPGGEEPKQPTATEISIEEFKAAQEAAAKAESELAKARAKAAEFEKKQAEIAAQKAADEKELAELRKAFAEKQAQAARQSAQEKAFAKAQAWKEARLKAISDDDFDAAEKRAEIERQAQERAELYADIYADQAETTDEINKRFSEFQRKQQMLAQQNHDRQITEQINARVAEAAPLMKSNPKAWDSFAKEKRYGRSVETIMAEAYAGGDIDTAAALVQEFVNKQKGLQDNNGAPKNTPKKNPEPPRMGASAATRSPNPSAKPVSEQEYDNATAAYRAGKLPEKEYSTIKKAFLSQIEKKSGWGVGFKF